MAGRSSPSSRTKDVLEALSPAERSGVLRALLERHPELASEAREIAVAGLSGGSVEDIASDVFDAVTSMGVDSLNGRAGRHADGYVEPTDAAWELLQEAVEDDVADMKRRVGMGMAAGAETIACGIVVGLYRAKDVDSDGPLGWAPDFPAEHAGHSVAELIRACSKDQRAAVRDRMLARLDDLVPDWIDMIRRAADGASRGK